ncbi:MAG: SLC13 family permease [Defluviitaleaceae bacterium]|nr:SLC13 family permease [Defluviitaleaceae bacterium]MCL2275738.1 SLC13 family permease [Defluviitaleaceae bacterium]
MEPSTIALIIIGIMMLLFISEYIPLATTSILACLAMAIFGVIPFTTAFAGFGSDIVFLMAGMITVGNALFETGAAPLFGKKIISLVGTNEKVFIAALIVVAIPISAFLSNTATAAIMLPLAASSIGASGGKLTKKNTYMIVGMAAVTGGGLTLVSSPPQLIAQNLLETGGHETMGFFDIGMFGLPLFALLLVYSLTIGYRLQKKAFDFEETLEAPAPSQADGSAPYLKVYSKVEIARMCISVAVLVLCVAGFVSEIWSPGVIAMLGAAVCIASGCISQKKAYDKMDWTTLIIFGSSFGFAAGLEQSGAGLLIAQGTITLLGDAVTPWLLCAVLALIAVLLTNFMSSTACAALLLPIGIFSAIELGYDVRSVAMAVAIAASIGYATPMSTPPMTMTLAGGYRFKDYIKMGGLFNILAYLLIIALFPLVLNL